MPSAYSTLAGAVWAWIIPKRSPHLQFNPLFIVPFCFPPCSLSLSPYNLKSHSCHYLGKNLGKFAMVGGLIIQGLKRAVD